MQKPNQSCYAHAMTIRSVSTICRRKFEFLTAEYIFIYFLFSMFIKNFYYWFSFSERGKLYSKEEVRSMQIGPAGLFFTGDGTGEVRVWKWLAEPAATP